MLKFTTAQEIFASLQIMNGKPGKNWKRLKEESVLLTLEMDFISTDKKQEAVFRLLLFGKTVV